MTSPGPMAASPAPTASCRPVGDTVDLAIPSWTNTIGAAELGVAWQDPDFDPALRAFYYARVIEIPTPRWTAYDAVRFDLDLPPGGAAQDPAARLFLPDLVRPGLLSRGGQRAAFAAQ